MPDSPLKAGQPERWSSLAPYAQLIRALIPRALNIAVFDIQVSLRWSSDTTVSPDLQQIIERTVPLTGLQGARADEGDLRLLGNNQSLYVCWLRDDDHAPFAAVAVLLKGDGESRPFAFVHRLLQPALECMRRQLLEGAVQEQLRAAIDERERDLMLLLPDSNDTSGGVGVDELKQFMELVVSHSRCQLAALIVPEKNIALVRAMPGALVDSQVVARAHRYLLQLAVTAATPVHIEHLDRMVSGARPCQVLLCRVRNGAAQGIGVLALFHEPQVPKPGARELRVAEILARRAAGIIATQYDALTGLLMFTAFEARVHAILAERAKPGAAWSVLYVNCDRLHVINDAKGMHVGDIIIGQLGELIRTHLPPRALAARLSGDRFTLLLPVGVDDATRFAETLRNDARLLGALHADEGIDVSISIGVAPQDVGLSGDLTHSLAAAEMACKAAKDRGRNRVAAYEPGDDSVVRRVADIEIVDRLRHALDNNKMLLVAQLVSPLRPGDRPVHYELLIRMLGEDGAFIMPGGFLPAAARYQLMPAIDRWVLQRTLQLLQPHAQALRDRPFMVSINVSGQSLGDDSYIETLFDVLENGGVNPGMFCFEITETTTIVNMMRAETLIRRLRRLGCGVALDDFGTGLCSLSYLRQLPVTMLKIDGSFVRDMLRDPRAESMVQLVAQLARGMSLETVAEFVENEEILRKVESFGIDYAQGEALAAPEVFDQLLPRLLSRLPTGLQATQAPASSAA